MRGRKEVGDEEDGVRWIQDITYLYTRRILSTHSYFQLSAMASRLLNKIGAKLKLGVMRISENFIR